MGSLELWITRSSEAARKRRDFSSDINMRNNYSQCDLIDRNLRIRRLKGGVIESLNRDNPQTRLLASAIGSRPNKLISTSTNLSRSKSMCQYDKNNADNICDSSTNITNNSIRNTEANINNSTNICNNNIIITDDIQNVCNSKYSHTIDKSKLPPLYMGKSTNISKYTSNKTNNLLDIIPYESTNKDEDWILLTKYEKLLADNKENEQRQQRELQNKKLNHFLKSQVISKKNQMKQEFHEKQLERQQLDDDSKRYFQEEHNKLESRRENVHKLNHDLIDQMYKKYMNKKHEKMMEQKSDKQNIDHIIATSKNENHRQRQLSILKRDQLKKLGKETEQVIHSKLMKQKEEKLQDKIYTEKYARLLDQQDKSRNKFLDKIRSVANKTGNTIYLEYDPKEEEEYQAKWNKIYNDKEIENEKIMAQEKKRIEDETRECQLFQINMNKHKRINDKDKDKDYVDKIVKENQKYYDIERYKELQNRQLSKKNADYVLQQIQYTKYNKSKAYFGPMDERESEINKTNLEMARKIFKN